jgi:hypothetical protein
VVMFIDFLDTQRQGRVESKIKGGGKRLNPK